MKRYIYYIWCLLGLGLLTGCMFEEESIETKDENLVHMVFTAMVEDGSLATKTVLDENDVDGFRDVLWEPEDVIGVATYNGRYQRFENVLEEPAASGVFEGSVNQDIMYYAIYPYRDNQQMSTSVNVTIPSKQTYKPNSFDGSAAPMVSKGNHAEPLHFMNLCGALAVQLTGNEKVRSIIFQANANDKVSGDGTVDPDYGDYPVLQMGDVADNFIILDCGEGVQLSGTPTSFHFVLPPGTYNGFKLIISTTDGQFMEKSTDKQLKIKRSIVTKAASFAFENTATNFTDLSERGTANSYIVTQGGYYSFDATVIGNGEFGFPANNNYHTNSPEIAPASAELLWADNHKLINGCGYDASTGMLKFLTSGDEGNAVIAAKDSEGNILWSWHIWMTDQPEEQVYNNNAGILMDRNLGATSATPGDVGALGLLYQWGRKDPFLGAVSIDSSTQRESTITWPSPVSSDATNGTIGYSVLNPTVFIKYNGSNYDWYYTGDSSTDDSRWQSAKTIYDPCPSGWRVPDGGSEGVWVLAGFTNTAFDDVNKGRSFEITSPEATWYPALGYLDRSNGALYSVGIDGHYWSVSPTGRSAYDLYFYGSSFNMTNSDDRAYGFAVRCTKDEGYVDISYPQVRINAIEDITTSSAKLVGNVKSEGVSPVTERGFIYGQTPDLSDGTKVQCGEGGGEFSYDLSGLTNATRYYVKAYATNSRGETQTSIKSFGTKYSDDAIHLSSTETANCYIVRYAGEYTFDCTVKGNSQESVGSPVAAEVLWETDNTSGEILSGDIISNVSVENNTLMVFDATGKEGNAVIAVKDASDEILWSWHIWVTDYDPGSTEQIYQSGVLMMDRNLGALSVQYGDVLSWGLFYQQGRKDPFVGCGDIAARTFASTAPVNKIYYESGGDDVYARQHPYIALSYYESNWTGEKGFNDPCPAGWKVPDVSVFQFSSDQMTEVAYGRVFPSLSGADIYFPLTGDTQEGQQSLRQPGTTAYLWTSNSGNPYNLISLSSNSRSKYDENPVRCMKDEQSIRYDEEFSTSGVVDLADNGSANSYIVSSAGTYSIPAVKGNSSESVGDVASAEVLWESFESFDAGVVYKCTLLKGAKYENGQIYFKTADSYREGNAVIAAKDADGTILWSWHIWLTDVPEGQVYYNNAGTMMDRNLGATSTTPGDVGALGLLYQWGRKDPFLSSSSISSSTVAKSTLTWPSAVSSDSSNGTIEYSVEHPTTFITYNGSNDDWYYTGSSSTDDTRWQSAKTIYDPCPVGWRVPDGGSNGVWSTALGSSSSYSGTYDSSNAGMNFSGKFGSASTIWYPASRYRNYADGALNNVGGYGSYWSVTPGSSSACYLSFYGSGGVNPINYDSRAIGFSVRCLQESK